jgi:hypothetical protein
VTWRRRRGLVVACLLLPMTALTGLDAAGFAYAPKSGPCLEAGAAQRTERSDELQEAEAVKEPNSRISWAAGLAKERLERCPNEEEAWYERIRGAEMLWDYFPGMDDRPLGRLAEFTAEAVRRVPDSPRIALVDARVRPEPGHVAALVARFPDFVPLRLALAQAQLAAGNVDAAAETMATLKDPKSLPGAVGTLAAIRLAKGDPAGALKALASRDAPSFDVKTAGSEAHERICCIDRQRAEIAYQAQLALHRPAAALRPLLDAAERGSKAAKALLKKPSPELAKAIAAARRSGKLSAIDREYLKK